MLLSDTWQPAVLQLLPFSSNDACNPQAPSSSSPSSARLRSLPTPDHSRGFPVLAVTRREKEGGASDPAFVSSTGGRGHGALGSGPSQSTQASRAVSERLTRSQTVLDPSCIPPRSRAKSEYVNRRAGTTVAAGHRSRSSAGAESSREQATCSITDINERIMSRATQRADSSSPDSGTAPFVTSAAEGWGQGVGSGRGLPKPAFSTNSWSPVNSAVASGIGGQGGSGGEGRYLVSKNGLWRSVTLTPGELELKKHRDQLERVTSGKQTASGDKMSGRRYHKMNIRDLPRSTTPLTDHDPDKLNMKQVIAFLQSKGKSQADAVELPREVRLKVQEGITFQRTSRSGAMRGSVRKATASSTAAELTFRASLRQAAVAAEAGEASRPSASSASHRTEGGGGEATRSSGRVHGARGSADNRSMRRSWGSSSRDHSQERPDRSPPPPPPASARKVTQKKPFRLHRFLTMVPSAREPAFYSSSSSPSSTSSPSSSSPALYSRSAYPPTNTNTATTASSSSSLTNGRTVLYPAGSLEAGPSRSAQKERTLCLDLASQSKSQTGQAKGEHSRSHTAGPRRAGVGQGGSEGRVQYRVPASRPRPSSLRVEQDASETQWKLAADFGERDSSSRVAASAADLTDEAFRQEKNVIRLPFVLVDSEDEDVGVAELKRPTKPQVAKSTKSGKSSRVKFELTAESWITDAEAGEAGGGEGMEGEGGGRRGGEGGGGRAGEGGGRGEGGGGGRERTPQVTTDASAENPSSQTYGLPSSLPPARTKSANNNNNNKNNKNNNNNNKNKNNNNNSLVTDTHSDTLSDHVHVRNSPEEDKLPEVVATQASLLVLASAGRLTNVAGTKPHAAVLAASSSAKRVNVNVPATRGEHSQGGEDVSRHRTTPEYVTLSLRKEPHRTRERTYMSEIGGSDVFSDDTCAARANSESVRMSLKSDDMTSLAS